MSSLFFSTVIVKQNGVKVQKLLKWILPSLMLITVRRLINLLLARVVEQEKPWMGFFIPKTNRTILGQYEAHWKNKTAKKVYYISRKLSMFSEYINKRVNRLISAPKPSTSSITSSICKIYMLCNTSY